MTLLFYLGGMNVYEYSKVISGIAKYIDTEIVDVRFFDLALVKDLVKVIVIEDGVTREVTTNRDLMKVEINRRKL